MARQNKATVKDESLGAAFTQGVNEGMHLTGYCVIFFSVGQKFVQRMPIVAMADVPEMIGNFVSSLNADDYAQGVEIKILQDENAEAPAEQPALDDGIEDAEVVE